MASTKTNVVLFACSLLLLIISTQAKTKTFRPKALVLPVQKDASTKQYTAIINQRTPRVPIKTTIDLGGQNFWVDCYQGYASSTFKHIKCGSAQCKLALSKSCMTVCYGTPQPGCHNNTCVTITNNDVARIGTGGALGMDVVSVQSTDGSSPGRVASVPNLLFGCGSTSILDGLAKGVQGIAGLGRSKVALPYQLSSAFSFSKKFALCLTSTTLNGVVFFGDGPYKLLPNTDASKYLLYTPLIVNPISTATSYEIGDPSTDYFIGVKSIKINGNLVKINTTLLSFDKEGYGGTKISTLVPYTVLETSIYRAVTKAFTNALSKVPRARAVAPFGLCFDSKNIGSTRVGPSVPQIDLVLQSSSVYWRIFGANSMVQVTEGVLCLGFVDGGVRPRTSIVIGGHQLEDNLLQFDLAASKLGFSSSLLFRQTTCANFNFTSKA